MITRKSLKRQLKRAEFILIIRGYDEIKVSMNCRIFSRHATLSVSGFRNHIRSTFTMCATRREVYNEFVSEVLDNFSERY